ncbi:MAG: hypothetical protein AB7R89_21590 [Dehalococcoidia bacterium]
MTTDPQLTQTQVDAVATTLEVMDAIAATTLRDLPNDPPKYLADLYCLAHAAYAIGFRAALVPHLDRMVVATLAITSAGIGQRLRDAYTQQQLAPREWYLNLNQARFQRHTDPAST